MALAFKISYLNPLCTQFSAQSFPNNSNCFGTSLKNVSDSQLSVGKVSLSDLAKSFPQSVHRLTFSILIFLFPPFNSQANSPMLLHPRFMLPPVQAFLSPPQLFGV